MPFGAGAESQGEEAEKETAPTWPRAGPRQKGSHSTVCGCAEALSTVSACCRLAGPQAARGQAARLLSPRRRKTAPPAGKGSETKGRPRCVSGTKHLCWHPSPTPRLGHVAKQALCHQVPVKAERAHGLEQGLAHVSTARVRRLLSPPPLPSFQIQVFLSLPLIRLLLCDNVRASQFTN